MWSCSEAQKPQNHRVLVVITCYYRMFCFFSGDTCHKFPPNQKRNTHSIKNSTTSTATKPYQTTTKAMPWSRSRLQLLAKLLLRLRAVEGASAQAYERRTWMIHFGIGVNFMSSFCTKSGPVDFLKTHFGNSSSNDLVLEFRPLQIAWVN